MNAKDNLSEDLELVHIGKFDKNKLVFGIPETVDIKGNQEEGEKGGGASFTKCTVGYTLSDNRVGALLLELPDTFCFGVSKDYKYAQPRIDKYFTGYSVCYYYQDPKDQNSSKKGGLDAMSEDQKKVVKTWEQLESVLSKHLRDNADCLPDKAVALAKNNQLVSAIARFPKKDVLNEKNGKKMKVVDKSKSMRSYFRLIQNKRTDAFISKFYDADTDEEINPLTLLEVRGTIKPIVKVEYVYIGEASSTFQIKLWEAVYRPQQSLQRKRLLATPQPSLSTTDGEKDESDGDGSSVTVKTDPNVELDLDDDKPKLELVKKRPPPAAKRVAQPPPKRVVLKRVAKKSTEDDDDSIEL